MTDGQFGQDEGGGTPAQRALVRVRRHVGWARTQGVGRLIEEDGLNPVERARNNFRKWQWRRDVGVVPGTARPVWLVGLQRSGTNMLVRGIEASPEFEVHNENSRRAFVRFRLRPDAEVRRIVEESRHRYVLFKPLCDSHRVDELLDRLGTARAGAAIWAYRPVDDRARSAVAKFGPANLQALRAVAAGQAGNMWQAQRLSPESIELIRSFDLTAMTPLEAASLFWVVRNALFFEMGLDRRPDVTLASYEAFVTEPEQTMHRLCTFLDFPFRPDLVAHVERRHPAEPRPLALPPRLREACDEMQARLDQAFQAAPA